MSMLRLKDYATALDGTSRGYVLALNQGLALQDLLYWVQTPGLHLSFNRYDDLPEAQPRAINETVNPLRPSPTPVRQGLKVLTYQIKLDRMGLLAAADPVAELVAQRQLAATSLVRTFNKYLFKGDSSLDPRQFDGLRRIAGIEGAEIEMGGNGDVLSLEKLNDAVDAAHECSEGDVNRMAIFMSPAVHRQLWSLLMDRNAVSLDWERSGDAVARYAGIPVVVIRRDAAGNPILGFNETYGAGDAASSLYVVSFARNEGEPGLFGAHAGAPSESDVPDPIGRTITVDWAVCLAVSHPYAVIRLKGITGA